MEFRARGLLLLFPLAFTSCGNPALRVSTTHSPAAACLGAALGATTTGWVAYVGSPGSPGSVGDVRFRWMLSADALPSTDDLTMLGTGAEVTIGSMNGGDVYSITSPDLTVPIGARLGPQYLILAAVDLGATSAGVSYSAVPITINQCPSPGACETTFPTEASYIASAAISGGPNPPGRQRERPVFLSDKSTLSTRGLTIGGHDGLHGLLLRYDATRTFRWGKSLSHCARDEVESIATFNDGTLAVVTAYYTGTRQEVALSAYSQTGTLLWQRVLTGNANSCTTGCGLTKHAVVAVDSGDDTAVAATSDGVTGPVELVRVDRYGNEQRRSTFTASSLQVAWAGGPYDIATYPYAFGSAHSDVLLGFPEGVALLDPALNVRWIRALSAFTPGDFPNSDIEVEMCTPTDLYVAATGVDFHSQQDVVYKLDAGGNQRWAISVQTGTTYGSAPGYTGPLGLLRQDRFALHCNEQELPFLTFISGSMSAEFPSDARAITLLHTGAVFARFRGTFPVGTAFAGAAGIDPASVDFLGLAAHKFSVLPAASLTWTRY